MSMPSSFPSRLSSKGQEGTRVFVVDAQNKVDVAKVTGVDSYRGLRVLEVGPRSRVSRVIVEGVQLVRQGQTVEPVSAPLEKFMTEESPPLPGDPRFNSRVSRVPGPRCPEPRRTQPERQQAQDRHEPPTPETPLPKVA